MNAVRYPLVGVTGLQSGGLSHQLLPWPRPFPLRLFLQQVRFRDGEQLADGVVKPFSLSVAGYARCW